MVVDLHLYLPHNVIFLHPTGNNKGEILASFQSQYAGLSTGNRFSLSSTYPAPFWVAIQSPLWGSIKKIMILMMESPQGRKSALRISAHAAQDGSLCEPGCKFTPAAMFSLSIWGCGRHPQAGDLSTFMPCHHKYPVVHSPLVLTDSNVE